MRADYGELSYIELKYLRLFMRDCMSGSNSIISQTNSV